MPVADLIFQRTIDLPPAIVWDALVDPELLAGWLGEVRIIPTDPPTVRVVWPGPEERHSTSGTVTDLEAPLRLGLETDNRGRIDVTLVSIPGGLRETSTELELRVGPGIEAAFAGRVRREWNTSLDRLVDVLHGHPVDWAVVGASPEGTAGFDGGFGRSLNTPR